MTGHAGMLLVATPQLEDPNFRRTVVLLLDHDDDGAVGVVLNRPSDVPVESALPLWAGAVTGPAVLFGGGPVGAEAAMGVAQRYAGETLDGFQPLVGTLGLVDLDHDPDALRDRLLSLRIFAGYSGWGAGQLEGEIESGSWYVVPSVDSDLLDADPAGLWAVVLRRQPGPLAYVASFPDDPTLN